MSWQVIEEDSSVRVTHTDLWTYMGQKKVFCAAGFVVVLLRRDDRPENPGHMCLVGGKKMWMNDTWLSNWTKKA